MKNRRPLQDGDRAPAAARGGAPRGKPRGRPRDDEALLDMDLGELSAALAAEASSTTAGPAMRRRIPRVGRGQAGIVRLRGRVWRLQYRGEPDEHGKRRQHSVRIGTCDDMSEAMARELGARMIEQLVPVRVAPGSSCAWEAWVARYQRVYLPLLRESSQDSTGSIIRRHLRGAFASLHLHQISLGRVQSLIARWRAQGVAPSTIGTRWSVLRRMIGKARAEGLAVGIPRGAHVDLPRSDAVVTGDKLRAFTTAELHQILAASEEPWKTLWQCCAFMGLRISEALGLRWSDIDLEAGRVHIRRQALFGREVAPKTASSIADRRIPPVLLERLRDYSAGRAADDALLFPSPRDGRPYHASGVRKHHLAPVLRELGIRGRSSHGFRHWFGLEAARAGVPLPSLQRALRHKDRRSTEVYTTTSSADVDSAMVRTESRYLESTPALLSALEKRNALETGEVP